MAEGREGIKTMMGHYMFWTILLKVTWVVWR